MSKFTFKNFTGSLHFRRGNGYKREEINPRRDWTIFIIIFVILSIAVIAFNAYIYMKINKGGFFITSSKDEILIESINRSDLENVINFYEIKEKKFQENKSKKPDTVDPSL